MSLYCIDTIFKAMGEVEVMGIECWGLQMKVLTVEEEPAKVAKREQLGEEN